MRGKGMFNSYDQRNQINLRDQMNQADVTRGTSSCAAGPSLSNKICRCRLRVTGNYRLGSSDARRVCRTT